MEQEFACQPEAEAEFLRLFSELVSKNSYLQKLESEFRDVASLLLSDCVDNIEVRWSKEVEEYFNKIGFVEKYSAKGSSVYLHPGAKLPPLVLTKNGSYSIGIEVENLSDFLMTRGLSKEIEEDISLKRSLINEEGGVKVYAVERKSGFAPIPENSKKSQNDSVLESYRLWKTRPRNSLDEEEEFEEAFRRANKMVELVGKGVASSIVLEVERSYWQVRNWAGQIQKARQDRLGIGWANHDHHTFRSSRRYFHKLIKLFEILGFYCRERFFAGVEAGWGAQVMEHPDVRIVLFCDVDLDGSELSIDFAHETLSERSKLGTIGLWCGLHGESILQAGMHHLEGQFIFEKLKEDLSNFNIKCMDPFSNFTYLKQAFTVGERWKILPQRVENLLHKKLITKEEADKFLKEGAIGSHLENLERKEGYKGFNKKNVSYIIKKTDPRSFNYTNSA